MAEETLVKLSADAVGVLLCESCFSGTLWFRIEGDMFEVDGTFETIETLRMEALARRRKRSTLNLQTTCTARRAANPWHCW